MKVRLVLQQRLYHARLVELRGEVEGRIAILVLHVNVGENVSDHGDELKYDRKLDFSSGKSTRLSIAGYVCILIIMTRAGLAQNLIQECKYSPPWHFK